MALDDGLISEPDDVSSFASASFSGRRSTERVGDPEAVIAAFAELRQQLSGVRRADAMADSRAAAVRAAESAVARLEQLVRKDRAALQRRGADQARDAGQLRRDLRDVRESMRSTVHQVASPARARSRRCVRAQRCPPRLRRPTERTFARNARPHGTLCVPFKAAFRAASGRAAGRLARTAGRASTRGDPHPPGTTARPNGFAPATRLAQSEKERLAWSERLDSPPRAKRSPPPPRPALPAGGRLGVAAPPHQPSGC